MTLSKYALTSGLYFSIFKDFNDSDNLNMLHSWFLKIKIGQFKFFEFTENTGMLHCDMYLYLSMKLQPYQ